MGLVFNQIFIKRQSHDPVFVKPGSHVIVDYHTQSRFVSEDKIAQKLLIGSLHAVQL